MSKIGEMVECNPQVKLQKGASYNVVDIDSIAVGNRTVLGKHPEIYNGQSGCHFANGDTVLARITPCLENGKFAQVRCETQKGFGSTELFVFRGKKDKTDNDYVYYLIAMPFVRKMAANSMTGASGRQRADLEFIKKIEWSFPPLPTQKQIASILSAYDNLIENNNKRIKILEQMAENLYKEWFVRFRFPGHESTPLENGIPKGWKLRPLFDVASVTYGFPFKSELFNNEESLNAVVRIRDILDNKTDTYTSESCDNRYLIKENAILIGMDGLFHMCLWNGSRAFLNQRVVMLNSKDDNICNYLLYLSVKPQIKFWEQAISGTTVAHLGDKHLKKVTVLIPNQPILKEANERFRAYMEQKRKLFIMNQNLIKQRDLLLPRLMSGKLAV